MGNEVEAIAKTTEKALDAGQQLGGFLGRIFGPALEECGGIFHDNVRFHRGVRLLALKEKYEQICKDKGIKENTKAIDIKLGIPLIEAASLEGDDQLQEMFARLLVNATDADSPFDAKKAFVSILADFGQLEAQLLLSIASKPDDGEKIKVVRTALLPDTYIEIDSDSEDDYTDDELNPEIEVALWNLARLGCVQPAGTWGGGATVGAVTLTSLGAALVDVCTA